MFVGGIVQPARPAAEIWCPGIDPMRAAFLATMSSLLLRLVTLLLAGEFDDNARWLVCPMKFD
jgi:hypothetical protein